MDRKEISELAKKMETKEDLLNLLNLIRQNETNKIGRSDKFYPFTMKHINYYCHPDHVFHRFRQFKIKKKSGGYRIITTPRNKSYMLILRCLNELFKSLYTASDYAMGFAEGRSVVTNAASHKGMNYVLNIDLKDFFPSIEQARIWKRLQLKPFEFPVAVANVIAGLVSMKESREMNDGNKKDFYVLPQGSPTSPIITNMICDNLDRRLGGLAKRFGLNYTRYADDITFSSKHNVYQKNGDFHKELYRIIANQGFTVNEKKTRLQKIGSRQEVTGIIVSNKLNVSQRYARDIRNILYIWDRYGYSVAYAKFYSKYKLEKGHVKKGTPDLINVIEGKLLYMRMIKGEYDSVYNKLYERFKYLESTLHRFSITTNQSTTYIETKTITEFEKLNKTEIVFSTSDPVIDQNGVIITPSKRIASFKFGNMIIKASINKSINKDNLPPKEQLSISCCWDLQKKQFWLIHKSNKITIPTTAFVDIDSLNHELDNFLQYG